MKFSCHKVPGSNLGICKTGRIIYEVEGPILFKFPTGHVFMPHKFIDGNQTQPNKLHTVHKTSLKF